MVCHSDMDEAIVVMVWAVVVQDTKTSQTSAH